MLFRSKSVSSSPASGSGLTAQSLEPASDSVSPSLSSGELHYSRLRRELWDAELDKMKEGGTESEAGSRL